MTVLTLPARKPFNFRSVVLSHGWTQLLPYVFDDSNSTLSYIHRLNTGRVVELVITGNDEGVQISIPEKILSAERNEIADRVTWMFALDMDFSEFYAEARKEPKLAKAVKNAQGRILRSPTLFEDVVKTILTTNTLWTATKRMNANLVAQFGEKLEQDPSRHAFPSARRLARVKEERLRSETRLGYRAPHIPGLARRILSGDLDLEALKTSDLPVLELRKELLRINGIGPYASANLLMILGRYDFLTVDSWALKLVSQEWHGGEPVTPAQVEEHFAKWGKWKGLAYWFWDWSYKGD